MITQHLMRKRPADAALLEPSSKVRILKSKDYPGDIDSQSWATLTQSLFDSETRAKSQSVSHPVESNIPFVCVKSPATDVSPKESLKEKIGVYIRRKRELGEDFLPSSKRICLQEFRRNIPQTSSLTNPSTPLHLLQHPRLGPGETNSMADSFNSFQFWKPCLPDIEDELREFLSESMITDPSDDMLQENPKFNNFNFWREPIPELDLDALL